MDCVCNTVIFVHEDNNVFLLVYLPYLYAYVAACLRHFLLFYPCCSFSDINECAVQGSCHMKATCTDTVGSFTCACNTGYAGDGKNCEGKSKCV